VRQIGSSLFHKHTSIEAALIPIIFCVYRFKLHPRRLACFLRQIEAGYHETNPYHNAIHVADVLQVRLQLCKKCLQSASFLAPEKDLHVPLHFVCELSSFNDQNMPDTRVSFISYRLVHPSCF